MKWFLLKSGFVKQIKMFCHISKWLLPQPPTRSPRQFFVILYCETLMEYLEIKLTRVIMGTTQCLGSLDASSLRLVHTEPPAIPQLQQQCGHPGTGFCGDFCWWTSALVSCDSWYLPVCLCSVGGSRLPCDLTSLTALRRVICICSTFHLSWQSGSF